MKEILVLAVALLVSACTSVGRLDTTAESPSDSEAVFVLSAAPVNYRVSVFPGSISDGKFAKSVIRPSVFYGAPVDCYVVGKAKAGDVVAITNVRIVSDANDVLGADFKPCGDAKTVVFQVPSGGVFYIGSVEYEFNQKDRVVRVRYGNELEAARSYVDSHYPALKGKLQQGTYQLMETTRRCEQGVVYIPIYVHR
jgi:hypothetical protein